MTSIVQGQDVPAFTVGGAGNSTLKPEKSTERELGFDLGLFNDRFSVEYTHYNKITRDELVNVNNAPSLGTSPNRFITSAACATGATSSLLRGALLTGQLVQARHARQRLVHEEQPRRPRQGRERRRDSASSPAASTTTQIFRSGLPLGAYYSRTASSYNDANSDGLIALPRRTGKPACEFTVAG